MHHKSHHATLSEILPIHATQVEVPAIHLPSTLTFHRFMRLDELVLTPRALVTDSGRQFVEKMFCGDSWTNNRNDIAGLFCVKSYKNDKLSDGFYSKKEQQTAQFSSSFGNKYSSDGNDNKYLAMTGFTTTLFYQQDLTWYERAGYCGHESSHYLIVPFVRFSVTM